MLGARVRLEGTDLDFHRLDRLREAGFGDPAGLPFTVKVLLEGLVRDFEAGRTSEASLRALASWPAPPPPDVEVPFTPSRVLLQDFTGVPAVVDLAAMRSAMARAGGDPTRIDPLAPADLVIDHSVQVDAFGDVEAYHENIRKEYQRNAERYALLRWAQQAFHSFTVVPPGMGICHQVNLERLSRVVQVREDEHGRHAIYDTLVGTDSHTTMANGLGVLGWGVGGIEAEAALLGQPIFLPTPVVLGVRFHGALPAGTTATDLVLTLTQMLRDHGVVNKFVEFCGSGLSSLSVPDRATMSNMCPEYGATSALFPVDHRTLEYLAMTGREPELIELVERYARAQGLFRTDDAPIPTFSEMLELDLDAIEPSVAGPKRPQDRVPLDSVRQSFYLSQALPIKGKDADLTRFDSEGGAADAIAISVRTADTTGRHAAVANGSVVIAAITSCTNTSNPSVMIAAGLLAKKAAERGLRVPSYVKTSIAPGSRVVTDYLKSSGVLPYLEQLGFYIVGYGCTTCIGNSGPLASAEVEAAVKDHSLNVAAVLSGNRNFEGRIHPLVRSSYLASPPLVVAFALAGTVDVDLTTEPIGFDREGNAVHLADIWPNQEEVAAVVREAIQVGMFQREYAQIFAGDQYWTRMESPTGAVYAWDQSSTYVQEPPYFIGLGPEPEPPADIVGARALVVVGDSVTTDHISPAGSIPIDSPAGRYLVEHGVGWSDFNSYGSRRGNHEVMIRGTFANIRLRNQLVPGREGYWTVHLPDHTEMTIFDAAARYAEEHTPLVVLAGKEYGSGSSRDWAAKGPRLLGVRAVIAETFERIHRSNLVQMGVLPLEHEPGQSLQSLGLDGTEAFTIRGLSQGLLPKQALEVEALNHDGERIRFQVVCRLDNETEVEYLEQGGILPMVLRRLIAEGRTAAVGV
ncbi:MAG TPA: aconitate hydratase AcnA [Candidatus Dormibacteraeota bacterium]|jgi:aconitate hydratase|nr:aconitate hydratase AcnA [Candidatus Dormibacteraeota bacterium]